eukprot:CAMPEP_0206270408 /NCGR_PEP_ID=MMETSP0047_2-20121206/32850_1 /ASSEMBLY_ACC=CAM_ASM_000192 /TAXON_ID=195065 /ORGANISM="Chroomonas mesostigmatica_cf, Strain CCMP1168" /LENGTH=60 /DNA_ID=CAMNT_0053699043 /DNA_START=28 /DNA_END=210 /DNA_ORIENTATION=-
MLKSEYLAGPRPGTAGKAGRPSPLNVIVEHLEAISLQHSDKLTDFWRRACPISGIDLEVM